MASDLKIKIKAIDKASKTLNRITLATRKINRAVNGTNTKFSKMGRRLKTVGNGAVKLGNKMKSIGGSMTKKLTLPIGIFAGFAVKKFADVEQGMLNVKKTTGLSMKDIEGSIFGISKRIPVAVDQLLEIAGAAGQLGVKGKSNIEKFTETFAKLQIASDISGEDGAKAITRVLTVTGDGVGNIDRFSAALVDLGNNAAASESEILGVANRIAGATGRFGLGSANVLGISTALKSLGKRAESSGTVVGKSFNGIDQAIRNGGKALKQLEIITKKSGKELKKQFQEDATSVFKDMVDGLARMQGEGLNTVKALSNMGIKGERVNDVLGTLINKNEVLTKSLNRSNKAYKSNNALNEEFAIQTQSFNSAMTRFNNTLTGFKNRLGKQLAPAIEFVTDKMAALFTWLEKNPVIEKLVFAFAGFLAILGPIIFAVGSFISMIGGILLFKAALVFLGISFGAIALLAAKFIGIVLIIVALGAAIYAAWTPVSNFLANMWNHPIEGVKFFLRMLERIIPFGSVITGIANKVSGFFGGSNNLIGKKKGFEFFGENKVGASEVKKHADNRDFVTRTNNAQVSVDFKNTPDFVTVKQGSNDNGMLNINNGLVGAY